MDGLISLLFTTAVLLAEILGCYLTGNYDIVRDSSTKVRNYQAII